MKIDIQKIKKQLGFPSDRPLTLQEKRRYMKFAVYPLFFLIFAGIVLLIYSPTEKEKAEAEKERGFNTEIPSPEESRMEGNKVSAYEREALSKKERGRKDRTSVKPVKRIRQEVVSSLAQPVNDGDFIAGVSEERNTGFHTPVGRTPVSDRNTIAACVHGTQTVSDGQALRVRLLEAMAVDDRLIPKGTVLTGGTRIQGERMDIVITNVEYQGTVIPVELEVYDADGQQGILIPNSLEYDAVREIAAGMGGSMGSSISISTDAGAQIASDLGKGVIQGVSQYITKKMRTVKVTLKAGHRLLLHSPKQ